MKRICAALLLLLVCFCACKNKPEEIIAGIKKDYAEINKKQSKYTPKRVDDLTVRGAGNKGTITGYYRDEEAKKIVSERFLDTARSFTEYYFDDGMLILVIKQVFLYNKPVSYTEEKARANNDSVWYDDKKTRMEVSRFYFHKNKLIKWIKPDGTDMEPGTAQFTERESELWGETAIFLKQLKEQ